MSEMPIAWKLGDLVENAESHFALDNFRRCDTCRFWDEPDVGDAFGDCRRRAPTALTPRWDTAKASCGAWEDESLRDTIVLKALWPETRRGDWCGEWEKRPWLKAPPEACDT